MDYLNRFNVPLHKKQLILERLAKRNHTEAEKPKDSEQQIKINLIRERQRDWNKTHRENKKHNRAKHKHSTAKQ